MGHPVVMIDSPTLIQILCKELNVAFLQFLPTQVMHLFTFHCHSISQSEALNRLAHWCIVEVLRLQFCGSESRACIIVMAAFLTSINYLPLSLQRHTLITPFFSKRIPGRWEWWWVRGRWNQGYLGTLKHKQHNEWSIWKFTALMGVGILFSWDTMQYQRVNIISLNHIYSEIESAHS